MGQEGSSDRKVSSPTPQGRISKLCWRGQTGSAKKALRKLEVYNSTTQNVNLSPKWTLFCNRPSCPAARSRQAHTRLSGPKRRAGRTLHQICTIAKHHCLSVKYRERLPAVNKQTCKEDFANPETGSPYLRQVLHVAPGAYFNLIGNEGRRPTCL